MQYSYDIEVAELEEEVRNKSYDPAVVFSKFSKSIDSGDHPLTKSFASEQRKLWRPKSPGDIHVEVRKSRYIPGRKGVTAGG